MKIVETDEHKIDRLQDCVDDLKDKVENLKRRTLPAVEFQLPISDSGIQLAGGPTMIKKRGIVMGVVPVQNGMSQSFGLLIKEDGQPHVALVDIGSVKWLED